MPEQQRTIILRCAYCQQETKLVVQIAGSLVTQRKPVSVVRYCAHCNRPNRLDLPDNVDTHIFILGQDRGFLGYQGGQDLPIIQGEQQQ